jgi:transcriptional regulator with GAF, ATPase, and Fis domain
LGKAVGVIAQILEGALPVAGLEFEYLDRPRTALETVASSRHLAHGRHTAYAPAAFRSLLRWCERGAIRSLRPAMAWPEELAALAGGYQREHVLLGPLVREDGSPCGVAILAAPAGQEFSARHEAVFQQLLEPLAVAVANDVRVRELAALRAAAEADKQSLLARLGRQQVADDLIGADGGLKPVMERVDLVARSDTSVVLLGDTGSG